MLSIIIPVRNQEDLVTRALDSIPQRNDIEIIVINDYSTDDTENKIFDWYYHNYRKSVYKKPRFYYYKNNKRMRVGGSINVGLETATGDYIMQLDSDDYLYTCNLNNLLELKRTEDLVFFNNQINNGDIWSPKITKGLCDHVCLYKRSIIGDIRHGNGMWGSGWDFHQKILAKKHTEYFFDETVYHYNFPRENSNYDLGTKGLL